MLLCQYCARCFASRVCIVFSSLFARRKKEMSMDFGLCVFWVKRNRYISRDAGSLIIVVLPFSLLFFSMDCMIVSLFQTYDLLAELKKNVCVALTH